MEAPLPLRQQPRSHALATGEATDEAATLNSSFLEFLTDDLVFGSEALDPATLEAVCQVANGQKKTVCGSGTGIKADTFTTAQPGPSGPSLKRPPQEDPNVSDSDEEEEVGKGEKSSSKKTKGGEMSAAATKKACREKARREKLNERFQDLARLVDPSNEPKTDKSTVLTDAIKYVQQMTVENHQLRQLNKFLEERVSALERERGQQLYQQSLMMTSMGQGQMMSSGQAIMVGGAPGMMAAPGLAGAAMAHPQLGMSNAAMASAGSSLLSAASLPAGTPSQLQPMQPAHGGFLRHSASAGMLPGMVTHASPGSIMGHQAASAAAGSMMAQAGPGGMMAAQMPVPGGPQASVGAAAGGVTFNLGGGGGHHLGLSAVSACAVACGGAGPGPSKPVLVNSMPGGMPYQGMYWLPPQMMDSTQDSLLRPPAA